jgi:hypothetical protein
MRLKLVPLCLGSGTGSSASLKKAHASRFQREARPLLLDSFCIQIDQTALLTFCKPANEITQHFILVRLFLLRLNTGRRHQGLDSVE